MPNTSEKPKIIRVPKTPKSSYNPNRSIKGNTLLEHQLKNLHTLELRLPPEQQTGLNFSAIDTEGEASEYIRRMTVILHPHAKQSSGR